MQLQAYFKVSQTEALVPGSREASLALQTAGTGGQGGLEVIKGGFGWEHRASLVQWIHGEN